MDVKNTSKLIETAGKYLKDNSPAILTGCGIVGVISSIVLAVKSTPKAVNAVIEESNTDQFEDAVEELGKPKTVTIAAKYYIPSVAVAGASIACFVGAQSINVRRNMAIAGLYAMTSNEFSNYKEAVIDKIGEKKEQEVLDEVSKKNISENPITSSEVILTKGETLFYDTWSGRYFKSTIETVRHAVNDINTECINELNASLNDFYFLIGLPSVESGEYCGWNTDNQLSVYFSAQITETDESCIVLNYHTICNLYDNSEVIYKN